MSDFEIWNVVLLIFRNFTWLQWKKIMGKNEKMKISEFFHRRVCSYKHPRRVDFDLTISKKYAIAANLLPVVRFRSWMHFGQNHGTEQIWGIMVVWTISVLLCPCWGVSEVNRWLCDHLLSVWPAPILENGQIHGRCWTGYRFQLGLKYEKIPYYEFWSRLWKNILKNLFLSIFGLDWPFFFSFAKSIFYLS